MEPCVEEASKAIQATNNYQLGQCVWGSWGHCRHTFRVYPSRPAPSEAHGPVCQHQRTRHEPCTRDCCTSDLIAQGKGKEGPLGGPGHGVPGGLALT